MSRNNVRGPSSALTEFLRESGITPTTIARRHRAREEAVNAANAANQEGVAGPSNAGQHDEAGNDEDEEEPVPKKKGKGKVRGCLI